MQEAPSGFVGQIAADLRKAQRRDLEFDRELGPPSFAGGVCARESLDELLRVWEVWDRYYCAEAHARHILFREGTRWPGYYYRGDFPKLDEANWKCFTTSRYDADKNEWSLQKKPNIALIP